MPTTMPAPPRRSPWVNGRSHAGPLGRWPAGWRRSSPAPAARYLPDRALMPPACAPAILQGCRFPRPHHWPAAPLLAPSPSTCPNGSPYNLLLKIALKNSVMFGCDVKNGRQEIDSRLPTKLSCCLESGGLSFAFQRLFAANPDLDLLRFGFCLLGHRD